MKGISTSSKVCPILSAMYSSSLNVYHTISHVKITMTQHDLLYNPNKFAIRDPRGGYWGGSKHRNNQLKLRFWKDQGRAEFGEGNWGVRGRGEEGWIGRVRKVIFICFETFLSPDKLGLISGWRNTLIVMILKNTLKTSYNYLISDTLQRVFLRN